MKNYVAPNNCGCMTVRPKNSKPIRYLIFKVLSSSFDLDLNLAKKLKTKLMKNYVAPNNCDCMAVRPKNSKPIRYDKG